MFGNVKYQQAAFWSDIVGHAFGRNDKQPASAQNARVFKLFSNA
jgi:hypothetical protein